MGSPRNSMPKPFRRLLPRLSSNRGRGWFANGMAALAVIVLEDGFEYQGRRYLSLSRIATLITGTRWSGPVFFGLKRRPATASERNDG